MRVAFITGITGGLGKEIAKKFISDGVSVYGTTLSIAKKPEAVAALTQLGANILELDVRNSDACDKVASQIISEIGRIDILVNNAGITKDSTFLKMSQQAWQDVIEVNLIGALNMTHAILPAMLQQRFGRVINVSSVNGLKGQFGQVNYSASKSGLYGFTKSLAQEVARKGVTVNSVSPGYLKTEMTDAIPSEIMTKIIATIPVGRLGEPSEVAELISFLASDNSSFITGSDFSINGGQI